MSRRRLTLANAGIRISRMRLLRLGFLDRRLLGYAMLCLAELLFDFGDFLVFNIGGQSVTPFGERFLLFGGGQFVGAEFCVNVTEMRVNGGVVTIALKCFSQSGFRFAKFVLLIINPAHAVEIGAVEGFFL